MEEMLGIKEITEILLSGNFDKLIDLVEDAQLETRVLYRTWSTTRKLLPKA